MMPQPGSAGLVRGAHGHGEDDARQMPPLQASEERASKKRTAQGGRFKKTEQGISPQ